MLACWVEDPNGDYFKKHLARIPDYMWVAEDGMKMQVSTHLFIFSFHVKVHSLIFIERIEILILDHKIIDMQSFGSQAWDTLFTIQALLASNLVDEISLTLNRGHDFIKKSQVSP